MKNVNKSNENNFIICGADGGTAFSVVVFVPLLISFVVSAIFIATGLSGNKEFIESPFYQYLGFFLSSFSLFLCLLYFLKKKHLNFGYTLYFKKCHYKYYIIAIILLFGSLFGLGWINDSFVNFLEKFGYNLPEIVLPKRHFGDYVLCFIIVGILPAFFEESIFRGVILNGARRTGDAFAIVVTGILFSLFHHNPVQTIYQFIMGMTFALIAIKSGSIIPSMLIHFLNNIYIITFYFLAPENYVFPLAIRITLGLIGIIAFAFGILYLIFKCKKPECDIKLNEDYCKIVDAKKEKKMFLIMSLAGVVGCLIMWIITLVG